MSDNQLDRALRFASETEKKAVFHKLMTEVSVDEVEKEIAERIGTIRIGEYLAAAKERLTLWGKFMGLSSGYSNFDHAFKGFVAGEVTVLGGYTSHGKTQVAANFAFNIAKSGKSVLFVTLEMTHEELTTRFYRMAREEKMTDDEFVKLPIIFQVQQSVSYKEVGMIAQRAKEEGAEIVFIDYLQYMTGDTRDERSELTRIIKELKRQALETKLPYVVLSQFSRPERDGKQFEPRPNILSFKGTSAIEQCADICIYAWREARSDSMVEIGVLKNRNRGIPPENVYIFQSVDGAKMNEIGVKVDEDDPFPAPAVPVSPQLPKVPADKVGASAIGIPMQLPYKDDK